MGNRKYHFLVLFLLTIIVVLVLLLAFQSNKPKSKVTVSFPESSPSINTDSFEPINTSKLLTGWHREDINGVLLNLPSYISLNQENSFSKSIVEYSLRFNPNQNIDFATFSSDLKVERDSDFVLDLSDRFIAYNSNTNEWYLNTNIEDKPNAQNKNYQNTYLSKNRYTPPLFLETDNGEKIYGPFVLGDLSRGKKIYLVPLISKNLIVRVSVTYNQDAIDASSNDIKKLKISFDKDIILILKSITSSI